MLSESYLYTSEAIQESLEHLTEDGTLVGAVRRDRLREQAEPHDAVRGHRPPRTRAKWASTTRNSTSSSSNTPTPLSSSLSTMIIKRAPFTDAEVDGFVDGVAQVPDSELAYAPGHDYEANPVSDVVTTPDDELDAWFDSYPYDVRPITDDAPFFWHFSRFGDVLADFDEPIDTADLEVTVGERVLVLLLLIAIVLGGHLLVAAVRGDPATRGDASRRSGFRRSTSHRSGSGSSSSRSR